MASVGCDWNMLMMDFFQASNVIGGYSGNFVAGGVVAATISGEETLETSIR